MFNPTEEMLLAGMEASLLGRPSVDDDSYVRSIWEAMWRAADVAPCIFEIENEVHMTDPRQPFYLYGHNPGVLGCKRCGQPKDLHIHMVPNKRDDD